jgi:acyl carrier protein
MSPTTLSGPKRDTLDPAVVASPGFEPAAEFKTAPAPRLRPDKTRDRVLLLVSEYSGFTTDLLALNHHLRVDLGFDSEKLAELFAAVLDAFRLPREEHHLPRDLATITDLIRFVRVRIPAEGCVTPPTPSSLRVLVEFQNLFEDVVARNRSGCPEVSTHLSISRIPEENG